MEIFNTTWKVLIPIFKYPTRGLTIREVSKLSGVTHPSVSKIVKELSKKELLNVRSVGKMKFVTGNFENEEFVCLKRLYNIISMKPFVDYIVQKYFPDIIILFGSYADGMDFERSDIDIYVGYKRISPNEKEISRFEKQFARKIEIISGKLSKLNAELRNNIINGIKLYGWLEL